MNDILNKIAGLTEGFQIDEEELWMLADYIVRLEDVIRAEAGFFMRFRLKYLLGLMD